MTRSAPENGRARAWLLAIRPATLTAAAAPVLVGTAVAARDGLFRAGPAVAALTGALLIQIAANLVNDADDFERGADTAARKGPVRVTQSGMLSAAVVRRGAWICLAAAVACGLYLAAVSGWPILVVGIAAIVSALAYTGGPWPLGYHGLGDLFVFLFFGVAAVVGTHYVQAGATTGLAWAMSVPVGALATAILVVNNVRDEETDREAGKRTLAVRLGSRAGRIEFAALVLVAYLVCALLHAAGTASHAILLPWLTLPWAVSLLRTMARCRDGETFNRALRGTARLQAAFALLLAVGLLL